MNTTTENTVEKKAKELIDKYSGYVCGYVGSSMLTNTEYPEQILKQSKECAIICVDEILKILEDYNENNIGYDFDAELTFYDKLKEKIKSL